MKGIENFTVQQMKSAGVLTVQQIGADNSRKWKEPQTSNGAGNSGRRGALHLTVQDWLLSSDISARQAAPVSKSALGTNPIGATKRSLNIDVDQLENTEEAAKMKGAPRLLGASALSERKLPVLR